MKIILLRIKICQKTLKNDIPSTKICRESQNEKCIKAKTFSTWKTFSIIIFILIIEIFSLRNIDITKIYF